MSVTIRTNNVPRDTLYWHELTDKERAEFDYLDSEELQQEATFFRYRGHCYNLGEFLSVPRDIPCQSGDMGEWDGYAGDSYFSGVLIRFVEHGERVIAATYFS